ncbi:MAG: cell division protein FtsQ/DivIB [Microthrixaceae bacterium]
MDGPISTLERETASSAPIDPRIRARRIEVRRDAGRRRLARLVDVGLVSAVALAFVGALWTPLLDVDTVRVTGADHSDPVVVSERSGIRVGDRLASLDLHAAGSRVAALPWVRSVSLHRRVDGVVSIVVRERTAVAIVAGADAAVAVDAEGRVLGPAQGLPGGMITLTDAGTPPAPGGFLEGDQTDALRLAARLMADAPGTVASLTADNLTGALTSGGSVRFGDLRQLDAKLRSLRTMLDQVDLRCLAVMDLRLPGSPVLTREEGCS